MPKSNMIVAVDLGGTTARVIDVAADFARKLDHKIHLIHVSDAMVDNPAMAVAPHPAIGLVDAMTPGRDEAAGHLRESHARLQRYSQKLRSAGLEARALLLQGPTAAILAEQLEELDADLLVVGSHEQSLLRDLFSGSVAKDLVGEVSRPILVVPPIESP